MYWCKDTGKDPAGPASEQGSFQECAEGLLFALDTWNHLQLRHTSCFISLLSRTFISGTVRAWNQSQLARRTKLTATATGQHGSCHRATLFSPSISQTQRGKEICTKALPLNSTKQQLPGVSASNNWSIIFKQEIPVCCKKIYHKQMTVPVGAVVVLLSLSSTDAELQFSLLNFATAAGGSWPLPKPYLGATKRNLQGFGLHLDQSSCKADPPINILLSAD